MLAVAGTRAQTMPSAMSNPYRLVTNWPMLAPGMAWGAAIGLIPDGAGGVWMGGGPSRRNPGWRNGVRIGSARDGSLTQFIPDTRPEGLAADEQGNIFAGLTGGCDKSPSGGCLQKWTKTR
jgi:hypothetical protein